MFKIRKNNSLYEPLLKKEKVKDKSWYYKIFIWKRKIIIGE